MATVHARLLILATSLAVGCAAQPGSSGETGIKNLSAFEGAPDVEQNLYFVATPPGLTAEEALEVAQAQLPAYPMLDMASAYDVYDQPTRFADVGGRSEALGPLALVPIFMAVGGGVVLMGPAVQHTNRVTTLQMRGRSGQSRNIGVSASRGVQAALAWLVKQSPVLSALSSDPELPDTEELDKVLTPYGPLSLLTGHILLSEMLKQSTREADRSASQTQTDTCETSSDCTSRAHTPPPTSPQPHTQPSLPEHVRIGSWNINRLGHLGADSTRDWAAIRHIIDSNFDVIGIVELMNHPDVTGEPAGYDAMLIALGSDWEGVRTQDAQPIGPDPANAEYAAIFYRRGLVAPCGMEWHQLLRTGQSRKPTEPGAFTREPAFTCLRAGGFDFMLGVHHAPGNGPKAESEAAMLDDAFLAMEASAPAGEDDFIIAGDFNLKPTYAMRQVEAFATLVLPGHVFKGSTVRHDTGELSARVVDHVVVRDVCASRELSRNSTILDVRDELGNGIEYFEHISDHLPIGIYGATGGPDDDCH